MKIGIEARVLSTPLAGMGRFLINMLKELHERDDGNEYYLYSHQPFTLPFSLKPSWHIRVSRGMDGFNGSWWLMRALPRAVNADGIDVFWGASHVLPPLRNGRTATLLTVHDLTYQVCPETMRGYSRFISRLLVPRAVNGADRVVCVSGHIGDEVKERFPAVAGRTTVIPEGVDTRFFKPANGIETQAFLKESFGINGPYILHVGTLEPRKRIDVILDAYLQLRRVRPEYGLVLAGGRGWKSDALHRRLRQPGIHYLEYVLDSHLPYLYTGAAVAVSASAYEGFGLPVLEAAACRIPVVLPDVPWARGVGGNAAYYYDAGDSAILAASLEMITSGRHTPSVIDVRPYRWQAAAEAYAGEFKRVGEGA